MSFDQFGLCENVMRGVNAAGYTIPTEIQQKAIPAALAGNDILGCAPTGTGKTAAFVLPMLHHLSMANAKKVKPRTPHALVLTPTRELAQQIEDAVKEYGKFVGLRALSIYGGTSFNRQLDSLNKGVDIVIATPGRLIDHLEQRTITLDQVSILVLDEADRMYDMGFIHAVKKIIALTARERQTMLFSATMSNEIRNLVANIQKNPFKVEVGQTNSPVDLVTQHFYACSQPSKMDLLLHVLQNETTERVLVFSRTKHGADRIVRKLDRSSVRCAAIHAGLSQSQRQQALNAFKKNEVPVLVATDIAARGIDVENISHVVNFDTPAFAEDYIHRIGRTGRALSTGTAFTFVSREEEPYVRRIQFLTGIKFDIKQYPGFDQSHQTIGLVAPAVAVAPPSQRTRRFFRKPRFACMN